MESIRRALSQKRNELKGLAILWVVLFHMQLGEGGLLYQVQRIGYGGVDIFFFLSGFGLYASLCRQPQLGGYLKRRAKRLLPAYLPFCALWLLVMIPLRHMGLWDALKTIAGNGLMLGYFFDAPLMINWYVSALAASILLAPLLAWLLRRSSKLWPLWLALCFGAGLLALGQNQMMAVSRLPVFFLGMVFASPALERGKRTTWLMGCAAAFLLGLFGLELCLNRYPDTLIAYGAYWYPFALMAPALCIGLAALMEKAPAMRLLGALGQASFEIFLWNVWLEWLFKKEWQVQSPLWWLLGGLVSIGLGIGYHALISKWKQRQT